MDRREFIEEFYPSMAGLGYKKATETNWTLHMPEIMVISYVTIYSDVPKFDIELGIAFNQVHGDMSWKKYRHSSANIKTTLYTLLQTLGEPKEELDKVFYYSPLEKDEINMHWNIGAVCRLYKEKALPYLEKFNDYKFLIKNFEKKIAWKPFEVKFYAPEYYTDFFKKNFRHRKNVVTLIPPESSTKEDLFKTPYALANAAMHKKRALRSARKLKPSGEVWAVVNGLEYLTPETIKIITQRGQEWHDKWPIGEPMYSRNDGYQFVIHTNQIMELLNIQLRTAQEVLATTRQALGKPKKSYVSVKEFCFINHLPEDETREALRKIQPDFGLK
jgi:hypothetical protein